MKTSVLKKLDEVYSKKNPSFFIKKLNNKKATKLIENRKNFLLNLKLPPKIFNSAKLLDLGCGSGHNSIVFDHLKAKCTLVEYNKKSFKNAKILFKKFAKKNHKFFNQDLFKFKSKIKYDIVVSNGVAHHTMSPKKNINIACKFTKKNGFLILGICTPEGWFQRNLQRLILFNISKTKKEVVSNSKKLFSDHLKRSCKFGLRTVEEVIFDTYINPKINCLTFDEIIKIFNKNNMKLYSSLNYHKGISSFLNPEFEQQKQSIFKESNIKDVNLSKIHEFSLGKGTNYYVNFFKYYKNLLIKLNLVTRQFNDLNFEKKLNLSDKNLLNLKKILKKNSKTYLFDKNQNLKFVDESINIVKILKLNIKNSKKIFYIKKTLKKNRFLFKKYNGVGLNYFVAYKP